MRLGDAFSVHQPVVVLNPASDQPKRSHCRDKVDGLRRERLLYADVLRKHERDWTAQRSDMVSLIKATSVAHEQRQKVQMYEQLQCRTAALFVTRIPARMLILGTKWARARKRNQLFG